MGKEKSPARVTRLGSVVRLGSRDGMVSLSTQYSLDLERWPLEPQPLNYRGRTRLAIYDALLILVPLGLIAKTVLCCISGTTSNVQYGALSSTNALPIFLSDFNGQFVTIWTIIFVTTLATFAKRLALYRAQKGESVAKLEQYQASTSLLGTLNAVWRLHAWSFISLALVAAWCFHYVGSQAILREYGLTLSQTFHKFPVYTPDFSKASIFNGDVSDDKLAVMNAQFVGSLALDNSILNSPHDAAGNALIPDVLQQQLPKNPGWSKTDSHTSWASFEGLSRLSQYDGQLTGSYETTTSYFNIDCGRLAPSQSQPTALSASQDLLLAPMDHGMEYLPQKFMLNYRSGNSTFQSTCTVTEVTLDLAVTCNADVCAVTKFRPYKAKDGSLREISTPFDSTPLITAFLQNLSLAGGIAPSNRTASLLTRFLGTALSDRTPSSRGSPNAAAVDLTQILAKTLSSRLSQAVNTYYGLSLRYGAAAVPHRPSAAELATNFVRAEMHGAQYDPQYRIRLPWIVADFVSCAVLLAAAVGAVWLRRVTLAPDILGFVSSVCRDNRDIPTPEQGSGMSGWERARAMRGVKIQIKDFEADGGVGRVGVGVVGLGQGGKLQRGRWYI